MLIGADASLFFNAADPGRELARIISDQDAFRKAAETGWRYYRNENDIVSAGTRERVDRYYDRVIRNPLRNADNAVPHPYHRILVDQKASYLFGKMMLIRSENKEYNQYLQELSKNLYTQMLNVCVDASNTGVSYLHSYVSPEGKLTVVHIPSTEGIPLWGSSISRPLEGFIRYYSTQELNSSGQRILVKKAEVWTATDMTRYTLNGDRYLVSDDPASHFQKSGNPLSFGVVPFAVFKNNEHCMSDLVNIKELVDIYDKTVSLYSNDIEDLQELIFVLINYGGQDLEDFLTDLKQYKAVKVTRQGGGGDGGVETMKVDIPVEARIKLLNILNKNIWNMGQGVDPEHTPNNVSGAALKHLYGLLELKASFTETAFTNGLNAILTLFKNWLCLSGKKDFRKEPEDIIYTRSMISNDVEIVQMCIESKDIISDETIVANHPWVDNPKAEIEKLTAQRIKKLEDESRIYLGVVGDSE